MVLTILLYLQTIGTRVLLFFCHLFVLSDVLSVTHLAVSLTCPVSPVLSTCRPGCVPADSLVRLHRDSEMQNSLFFLHLGDHFVNESGVWTHAALGPSCRSSDVSFVLSFVSSSLTSWLTRSSSLDRFFFFSLHVFSAQTGLCHLELPLSWTDSMFASVWVFLVLLVRPLCLLFCLFQLISSQTRVDFSEIIPLHHHDWSYFKIDSLSLSCV